MLRSSVCAIVAEALGLTNDQSSYVYLSDGGHFENLGLYEMVLRRCGLIVISDGSADADFQFDGLGNAVQKIRADFGIPIDFQPMEIFPRRDKKKGAYCAIGTIRYSCVDAWDGVDKDGNPVKVRAKDGTIVYIKPVFYGDEPRDIYHYAIDPTAKTVTYVYTYENSFLPDDWKKPERAMVKPYSYETIFPLKRAQFDGISVWVPNDTETFLKAKYGENLDPTMVWNEATKKYDKVEDHPYWQIGIAH